MNNRCPVRALSRAYFYRSRYAYLSRALTTAATPLTPTPSTFPLKTVTRSNFGAALEALKDHVRAADFVAIDLEMTGITSAPWRESFEFDRYEIRYLKIKDSAEKFAVVQFGVCPFRWDPQKLSFVAHPYNFYLFPRQELSLDGSAYGFLCQTASIDFLAKYQFDFNACIREGISYLSREQENEMLRRLDGSSDIQHELKDFNEGLLNNITDVLFCERMKNRIKEWREKLLHDRNRAYPSNCSSSDSRQQLQTVFYGTRPALCFVGFTGHQLKLIKLVTGKHFEDLSYVSLNGQESCGRPMVVYTDSKTEKDLLMKEVEDENRRGEELKIHDAIGFRHVIDLLSSEQKLIIGHNCFLDIAHIYNKFFGCLPFAAEDFVFSANEHFPYIIDTKVLLNSNLVLQHRMKKASTSLSSGFARLCPQIALGNSGFDLASKTWVTVEVEVDDLRFPRWNSGAKHEAGFDAFMTGCIFAQSCTHLGMDLQSCSSSRNFAHDDCLKNYVNRLYLSWNNGDIINLSSGTRTVDLLGTNYLKRHHSKILFENIVLIWGFPQKLKARDIKECISKVFGAASVASVYHLDDSAVFVYFKKAQWVSDFLVLKETLERDNSPISILNPLWKLLEGGGTCAADYETYKEICSSPVSEVLFADQARAVGIKWKTKLPKSAAPNGQENRRGGFANSSQENAGKTVDSSSSKVNVASGKGTSADIQCQNLSREKILDSFYSTETEQIQSCSLRT